LRLGWILDPQRRVGLHVPGIERPAEKTAHHVEEMPGLRWRCRPAIAAGDDMLTLDRRCRLVAGQVEHAAHDVLALASGRKRKRRPGGRFAVSLPHALKRTDRRFLDVLNGRAVQCRTILCLKFWRAEGCPDASPWPMAAAHVPIGHAVAAFFAVQVRRAWSRHGLTK